MNNTIIWILIAASFFIGYYSKTYGWLDWLNKPVPKAIDIKTPKPESSIDALLLQASAVGEVSLFSISGIGWSCRIEIKRQDIQATLKSNNKHNNPKDAVFECISKLGQFQ